MKKIKRIPQKHFDLKRLQPETLIPCQQISEVIEKPIEIFKSNISSMLNSDQYQDNFQANQTFTTSWINLFPHHDTLFTAEHCGLPGFRRFLEQQTLTDYGKKIKFPKNFVNFKGYADNHQYCELGLSEGLPNHLIINDIMLSNPADQDGRMRCGIFDEILNRVETFAKKDNYSHLILTAAFEHLVPVFFNRGFDLLDCKINDVAINYTRQGFILTKKLT